MKSNIHPVILAGGSGTRLWPRSREKHPKQFIALVGEKSLFQITCMRFADRAYAPLTIVTHEQYRFLVRDQLHEIGIHDAVIITEPTQKNTAAACLAAAKLINRHYGNVPLLFTPADLLISEEEKLFVAINKALRYVLDGKLCLFGIEPRSAHPGYGYMVSKTTLDTDIFTDVSFVEKPPQEEAERLILQGACWNSGIYFCTSTTLIEECKKYIDEHEKALSFMGEITPSEHGYYHIPLSLYEPLTSISIDKAVTEQTNTIVVIKTKIIWRDLGSWMSLYEHFPKNDKGNVTRGDVVLLNTSNSYIESNSKLVSVFGLTNIGLIETSDAILIFPLTSGEGVKEMVSELAKAGRDEISTHSRVHRPWGYYDILAKGDGFQSKKITVLPGAQLSLQRHKHRAEHWVVVTGTAIVTRGEEILELKKNESIYISPGMMHRLQNHSDTMLELIEVQTGDYLGEDDIERFDDKYGRS